MADIRIKDLATTAASTASDDFVAVDGSANGTRKLNAYSPTFGGNVVATGTLTVNSTTDSSSKDTGAIVTEGGLGVEKSATIGGNLTVSGTGSFTTADAQQTLRIKGATGMLRVAGYVDSVNGSVLYSLNNAENAYIPLSVNSSELFLNISGTPKLTIGTTGNTTLAGNLTVSGTGTSSVAGSFGVGSATDISGFSSNVAAWIVGGTRTDGSGVYPVTQSIIDNRVYNSTNPPAGGGIGFGYKYNSAGNTAIGPSIQGFKENTTDGNYASGLRFLTRANGASPAEVFRLTSSGNFLLKSDGIDSSNGRLQLATHTTSAGGIGFGTAISLYSPSSGVLQAYAAVAWPTLKISDDSTGSFQGGALAFGDGNSTARNVGIWRGAANSITSSGNVLNLGGYAGITFTTGAAQIGSQTTALTLDSSQNATFAGTAKVKNQATLNANGNVSVGTSATTIYSGLNTSSANWCFVFGDDGSAGFADVVVTVGNGAAVVVISSGTVYGSPAARTYTTTGANLQLANASGTKVVRTFAFNPGS